MPIWPFRKSEPQQLNPTELRDKLIEAASSGSRRQLRSVCKQYKAQVADHVDVISKIPDGMPSDDGSIDRYFQALAAVAQCLANECGAPELWNKLCGNPDDNPLIEWDRWFGELPERMQRLEYEELISEANRFIEKAKTLRGGTARLREAYLHGRLGELLFHSGRVNEALGPIQSALDLCIESHDVEGQVAYLTSLLEAHRYLVDGLAVSVADRLLDVKQANGLPSQDVEKRLATLRKGEPLCRIVCVRDGEEFELDEISEIGEGSYQFHFRRNRLSLHKATTLTAQGNQLALEGRCSDALEKFHEASEVDPYDPDPVYQSGMCLLELGAYGKGREAFEEVERLAPGWFRCRSDRWLADGMDRGLISNDELLLLRTLDDGGLPPQRAIKLLKSGIENFPEFAPLYLFLGNFSEDQGEAVSAYRRGLEFTEEPDLESRLLCALAARLDACDPERKQLVQRAVGLEGSLVAMATAKLMGLQ